MRSIHVLRKPCSESTVVTNVLRWGTGAINVDAGRIHSGRSEGGNTSGETALGQGSGWNPHNNRATTIDRTMSAGRWPANMIIQHLDDCVQTGTREEPGYTVNRFTDGAKPFGGGAGHPYESERLPPSTVAVWACVEGCPVAGLDAQSGVLSPQGSPKRVDTQDSSFLGTGFGGGATTFYGDTGGASRFFKQVGGTVRGEE